MQQFTKQPADVLVYSFPLAKWMAEGDTVTNSVVSTIPALGITATVTNGDTLTPSVWVSGGADGTEFKITLTVTTLVGRVKEFQFRIAISEI